MTLIVNCRVGLEFFEYLKETNRTSVTDRTQLKDIYNGEFRSRNPELKDANFSRVVYALKVNHKVSVRRGRVCFHAKVKALYQDQWSLSRAPKASPIQRGVSGAGPAPVGGAESGVRGRRKLASLLMSKLKTDKSQFIADKNGISVTSDQECTDGKICFAANGENESVLSLYVENGGTESVLFTYYTPLHWLRYFNLVDEHRVTPAKPLALTPGSKYEIQVRFQSSLVGFYPATLAFEFRESLLPSSASFHIVRFIEARYVTSLGLELAPVAPYRPRPILAPPPPEPYTVVDGQPPEGLSVQRLKIEVGLQPYKVPTYMDRLLKALKSPTFHDERKAVLESLLTMENYSERFHLLLFLEEMQMKVDITRYNIPNDDREDASMVQDQRNKKLLILEVPGVAENRPSVLPGDRLLVFLKGLTAVKYRGYVHAVELEQVKLGFSSQLLDKFVEGMKFGVEFIVNCLTMRVQHRAVDLASEHRLGRVLFPQAPLSPSSDAELPALRLFDYKLEQNPEQYKAVQHIVAGSSRPAPYLVFGPPGTGKTVTLVEAIKQIEKTQASCHILACAPSNSAADLLCKKILEHIEPRKLYRMYASSRDAKMIPDELKACCNWLGNAYEYPLKEELLQYRIMVTTLLTAGRLVTGGIHPGHFTHVFVDEAGHAVESECIVPLAGLVEAGSSQVVLAGDPKQLGPIIRSPLALKYGMGVSLLERLMTTVPMYQKDEESFDNRFVTKLLRNYRSHPAILKIPNELFYNGELQVCANEIIRNSYCGWQHLPKQGFPVIFHGVMGLDEREASSPSFFNVAEVEVLVDYVRKLFETQGRKGLSIISPGDIGIIAPYRKQVQKIRRGLQRLENDLRLRDMKYLKVGSVEEFQGQERKVILVSAVRSSPHYMELDQEFSLGFVKNEKRFNVAVTRAKALLVVVGNPRVLSMDPVWARFIQYCKDEGGYTGFSPIEEEEVIVERLAALYITIEAQVETEESEVQQLLDPEWRSDL